MSDLDAPNRVTFHLISLVAAALLGYPMIWHHALALRVEHLGSPQGPGLCFMSSPNRLDCDNGL